MQHLEIEHKKIPTSPKTTNQKTEQSAEELGYENKREGHGQNIALTKRVYRLQNSDTFYVESESTNDLYYFVKYNPSVFEYCSCPDNSIRGMYCKHLHAVVFSIKKGTLKDIDKLPEGAKRYPQIITKSYRDEAYDF